MYDEDTFDFGQRVSVAQPDYSGTGTIIGNPEDDWYIVGCDADHWTRAFRAKDLWPIEPGWKST